jgi:hypothetical protein
MRVPSFLRPNVPTKLKPRVPCWQSIAARLPAIDPSTEWYTLDQIAPLLGIKVSALTYHCRGLWPGHVGHWRLSRADAERLIKRVCRAGKKVQQ